MTNNDFKGREGLDPDTGAALRAQIRDLWTHGSTAIEGNTLISVFVGNGSQSQIVSVWIV